MGLRLPLGQVTVLMGAERARRHVMGALDEGTGRCAGGHGSVGVQRLSSSRDEGVAPRLASVAEARDGRAAIVLVDRLTDGLSAADRRSVLSALRGVAGPGRAVLVDDADPVAALSFADGALRSGADGGLSLEPVEGPGSALDYLAS
ncbi:hypothetical protein ACWKWC_08725 [Geodermatophilus nigrescens]|uniref:ABC transporter n=1 Tax=Geodermatophilus nigrescens TaxID=1070870 RepID=A0A1M5JGN7_9ACTN|nr:hypothetical protein [Geodermatophilus nigrescens]SHG39429.1 hypothetical protein SAMN05444351_2477 [Geodermatophilus nigrescens]